MPSDVLLRLLPDELPNTFRLLPPDEQMWRGRVFLMTWVLFGHEAYSWFAALSDEPWFVRSMQQTVAETPDERIVEVFNVAWEERRHW